MGLEEFQCLSPQSFMYACVGYLAEMLTNNAPISVLDKYIHRLCEHLKPCIHALGIEEHIQYWCN